MKNLKKLIVTILLIFTVTLFTYDIPSSEDKNFDICTLSSEDTTDYIIPYGSPFDDMENT